MSAGGGRNVLFVGGLVLLLLVTLGLAGGAAAGTFGETESLGKSKGLEYMRARHLDVSMQAGAPAVCNGEASVVGGGGSINGASRNAMLNASYPPSPGESWQAEGRTLGMRARTVTSYAVCGANDVTFSANPVNDIPPGGTFNTGDECADGERPIGGGLRGVGGNAVIRGLIPRPEFPIPGLYDWTGRVVNLHETESSDVTFFRACTSAYTLRYRSAAEGVPAAQQGKVTARCKRQEAVAAGGFEWTKGGMPQLGVWAVATQPWDSSDDRRATPDDGWRVRSHNDSGQRMKLTTYAICKAKPPG